MLERTAASLESCNLQRVLSKPPRSTNRRRQLHTAFWQHGASAIEILGHWPLPARVADAEGADSASSPLQSGLFPSAFVLDFLYPNDTYKLLRRLYPSIPRPQDSTSKTGASRRRHFTAKASVTEQNGTNSATQPEHGVLQHEQELKPCLNEPQAHAVDPDSKQSQETETSATVHNNEVNLTPPNSRDHSATLIDLLSRKDEERYHDVWNIYCQLNELEQIRLRAATFIYLSKSPSVVQTTRATTLFQQIPVELWNDEFLEAGVDLLIRSGDLEAAAQRFQLGASRGLSGGLDHILFDAFTTKQWHLALKSWLDYSASFPRENSEESPADISLDHLQKLPGLTDLLTLFEEYIAERTAHLTNRRHLALTWQSSVNALRRKLTQMVLQLPCSPSQAGAILKSHEDPGLYEDYLLIMLDRLKNDLESKTSLLRLPDIYNRYRQLPGKRPPSLLLRGMFHLYFPRDREGIKQLYGDWHDAYGDLNQWGFQKFLGFYADAGDVDTVRELWRRFVARYPDMLNSPRAFRSTMNVYAQIGDIAQARQEMDDMKERYGITPDLITWNTLLKCCVRANDYEQVLSTFEHICKIETPDSYTYAHVMTMCAKRGDVQKTLEFFNRSQRNDIPISQPIAMSLVNAYCRNDRLVDAEALCKELARRKTTNTTIWNQLIHFNGLQGNLKKCYDLLESMKKYDVPWDHQTHEFLLQALVTVNQVHPAFHLLKRAYQDDLFSVGPEHVAIVMAGAVRTGESELVDIMMEFMRESKLPMTFNSLVMLLESTFKKMPSKNRPRILGQELVKCLKTMRDTRRQQSEQGQSTASGDLMELRNQTHKIGRAVALLVDMRDFRTVEELVNVYVDLLPDVEGVKFLPPDVTSALMLGYLNDTRYDLVHRMWQETFDAALTRDRQHDGEKIHAAYEYDLNRPLTVVVKAFRARNNGSGLLDCVEKVTSAGFKLTRSNWNTVIRDLSEMGQWQRAMEWCEEYLMPGWRGWDAGKRPLQERRQMKNTRQLEASSSTILGLCNQWLKLDKLAAWSADLSRKMRRSQIDCPALHHAFRTVDYETLPMAEMPQEKPSLNKSIGEVLKPFSQMELKAMEKDLQGQLRVARREESLRRATRNRTGVTTRAGGGWTGIQADAPVAGRTGLVGLKELWPEQSDEMAVRSDVSATESPVREFLTGAPLSAYGSKRKEMRPTGTKEDQDSQANAKNKPVESSHPNDDGRQNGNSTNSETTKIG